ncbi:TlpA disulfide reductase family protein [Flagellimonas sp. GZD32]|uniref:TlpA disulfide reductase family protein n=1 Tax=Flagellimonas cixiensis TaxID=3228750 RepID=UPI0035C938C3
MNRLFILFAILVLSFSCKEQKAEIKEVAESTSNQTQTEKTDERADVNIPVFDFDALEPMLYKDDGNTYIVNFWATWCQPCIAEMPFFEQVYAEQKDNNVRVILVNLDMPNMWKSRLEPYVEKNNIQSEVVILDDPKQNEWIPKVSEEWGGAIPATLIYNKDKRSFYERGFTYEELNEELSKFTN